MKTLRAFVIIIIFSNFLGCEKLDLQVDVPDCIERKIKEFKKSDISCDSGAKVLRFDFQGIQVYAFQPGDCVMDFPTEIYDSHCKLICKLGGFGSKMDCNGELFSNATNQVIVWEN